MFFSNFDWLCLKNRYYYLQVFIDEFKYLVKETKMSEYITDDIEISSDDIGKKDSNEKDYENCHGEN